MKLTVLAFAVLALVACDRHEWEGPEGTSRLFESHGSHDDHSSHGDSHDDHKDHGHSEEKHDSHGEDHGSHDAHGTDHKEHADEAHGGGHH